MKNFFYSLCLIIVLLAGCVRPKVSQPADTTLEYFVRPCEFVCDYPFNDTTKWAITCRVWGLLKYYHPNVTAGKLDWDKVLLDMTEDIFYSSTPEMVNAELKKMLDAAGKYKSKRDDNWNDSLNMNLNLCWLDHSFLDKALQDELKEIASSWVKDPYYGIDYDSDWNLITPNEKVYNLNITASYRHRLLSLFRYWNVIYYFSPHKYLMDKSWDRTLSESVFPFIKATDKQSYQIAILKLAASLNDGHAYATIANYYPHESSYLVEKVAGKTVVKIDRGGLRRGDIVNHIGGRDIDRIRDSLSVLIPASTQGNKEYRINCYVAEMIFFHETDITISRKGQKLTVHALPYPFEKKDPVPHRWITNDIGYVDLSILTTGYIDLIFQAFSDAKGIIFDLRNIGPYEHNVDQLRCYLSNQKIIRMCSLLVPDRRHPGAYFWSKNIQDIQTVIPDSIECDPFQGKTVFLINEATQSYTEAQAIIARNFHATLIGRPTSGALGRAVSALLPDDHRAAFSGFGLFSFDGTEYQRKGIIPDIEVYPTMESIREGKDEILEAAIEYLNKITPETRNEDLVKFM